MTKPHIVVAVVYAAPGVESHDSVNLAAGSTVGDAVAASGVVARLKLDMSSFGFAIFGRRVRADTLLADGDRVELTRPLITDPKGGRRKRAAAKDSGRPNAKIGHTNS